MTDIFGALNLTALGTDLGGFFEAILPTIVAVIIGLAVAYGIAELFKGLMSRVKGKF
jgi:hypothetical protein